MGDKFPCSFLEGNPLPVFPWPLGHLGKGFWATNSSLRKVLEPRGQLRARHLHRRGAVAGADGPRQRGLAGGRDVLRRLPVKKSRAGWLAVTNKCGAVFFWWLAVTEEKRKEERVGANMCVFRVEKRSQKSQPAKFRDEQLNRIFRLQKLGWNRSRG